MDDLELARAYVPMQKFKNIYPLEEGLYKGTVFPELYKPMYKQEKKVLCSLEGGSSDE